MFNFLFKRRPADQPGQVIPTPIINMFPLLQGLRELIGFDLRQLTADKLTEEPISESKRLDGTEYSGLVVIHQNYFVSAEKGTDINDRPYYAIDIFARNVNTEYLQELCVKLYRVYGTPYQAHGTGKWTSYDQENSLKKNYHLHKYWQNLKLIGYDLHKCIMALRTFDHGKYANLHFYVFID